MEQKDIMHNVERRRFSWRRAITGPMGKAVVVWLGIVAVIVSIGFVA